MILTSTLFAFLTLVASGPQMEPGHALPAAVWAAPSVAGRVLSDSEEPLPGVVVTVQGTPNATSTNASGDFLLPLADAKAVLVFKCQGYRDQTLAVSGAASLTVKMHSLIRSGVVGGAAEPAASAVPADKAVLNYSEVPAEFPGGDAAYARFVSLNAHYPEEALARGLSGKVFVSFVVDEQGRIVDAEVTRGAGHGFDEEALRLIRLMPWWNPGQVAGKPVRVRRTLAVPFAVKEK
jgi:TonB family protein